MFFPFYIHSRYSFFVPPPPVSHQLIRGLMPAVGPRVFEIFSGGVSLLMTHHRLEQPLRRLTVGLKNQSIYQKDIIFKKKYGYKGAQHRIQSSMLATLLFASLCFQSMKQKPFANRWRWKKARSESRTNVTPGRDPTHTFTSSKKCQN